MPAEAHRLRPAQGDKEVKVEFWYNIGYLVEAYVYKDKLWIITVSLINPYKYLGGNKIAFCHLL